MYFENVVVLCPKEVVSLEPIPMAAPDVDPRASLAEDAVEAAWATGEFGRLAGLLKSLAVQSERAGLPDVVHVAQSVESLLGSRDEVALAAVVARLIRVGETSLATLLEISYRQI